MSGAGGIIFPVEALLTMTITINGTLKQDFQLVKRRKSARTPRT
jgi:hypothetical protein